MPDVLIIEKLIFFVQQIFARFLRIDVHLAKRSHRGNVSAPMTDFTVFSPFFRQIVLIGVFTCQVIDRISDCITCITDDIARIIEYSICSVCAA